MPFRDDEDAPCCKECQLSNGIRHGSDCKAIADESYHDMIACDPGEEPEEKFAEKMREANSQLEGCDMETLKGKLKTQLVDMDHMANSVGKHDGEAESG